MSQLVELWRRTWFHSNIVIFICFYVQHAVSTQHREHKVHNIVLYPDRHSWCNATPIVQVVGQPGCEPVEVENSVCVGACFSYSIPRTEPDSPGQVAPYCDSCQPSHTSWKHVTLKCNWGEYESETLSKRVEIIEGCQCGSCDRHGGQGDTETTRSPNLEDSQPQLMSLVYNTHNNHSHKDHLHLDTNTSHRLSLLLMKLSEEEDKGILDKEALQNILSQIKSQDDQTVDKNLLHHHGNSDQVALDIVKLRHILGRIDSHNHRHMSSRQQIQEDETGKDDDGDEDDDDDEVRQPTLDVASHHLKPALAGSEISYLPNKHHSPDSHQQDTDISTQVPT